MSANTKQQNGQRWGTLVLVILLLASAGYAAMMTLRANDLDAMLAVSRTEATRQQGMLTNLTKDIKGLTGKLAALEQQQKEADTLKALVAAAEPQIGTTLDTVINAKATKPDAKAAALAGMGIVAQAAHGASHEAALALHNRALAADAGNCVARLGLSLGGVKDVEIPPACAALLPATAAGDTKPAAPEGMQGAAEKPAAPAAPAPQAAAKN